MRPEADLRSRLYCALITTSPGADPSHVPPTASIAPQCSRFTHTAPPSRVSVRKLGSASISSDSRE